MSPITKCNHKDLKLANKKVRLSFDMEDHSSDGGLIPIAKLDEKLGITETLSQVVRDYRHPLYIKHVQQTLFQQRIYGMIQGYEDCNDHAQLREDALFQLVCGKHIGEHLASQSTLCRFENEFHNKYGQKNERIYYLEEFIMDLFVKSLTRKDRFSLTLDIDTTDSETFGNQQLTLFRKYYFEYMYFPILIFHHPTGRLAAGQLRPGNAGGYEDGAEFLERLIQKIKARFPHCSILVRGDSAFGVPEIMDKLEELDRKFGKVSYELGLTGNENLEELSISQFENTLVKWRQQEDTSIPLKQYYSTRYAAGTWEAKRRVVFKVEVSASKKQVRYVVTNRRRSPKETYTSYCQRSQMENWIGDFKTSLKGDRMSCTDWFANQFRFQLFSFAYVLFNELRLMLNDTKYGVMRLWNLCSKLLKVSVSIKVTHRFIRLRLPRSFPYYDVWSRLLLQLE